MQASNGSEELVYLLAEGLLLFHLPQHLNLVNFNALGLDLLRTGNGKTLAAILLHAQCRRMRACMSMGFLRVIPFDVMSLLHILDCFRGKMLQLLRQSLLPESLAKRNIVNHRCKLQTCKLCLHQLTTDSL